MPTRPRRIDPKLLLASFAIALGVVLVVLGIRSSVTGDEQQDLPAQIEEILPVRGATQVLAQSQVFVDLLPGYEAELTIDGITLETLDLGSLGSASGVTLPQPGQQITLPPVAIYEPGNNTLTYTPQEGGAIERFEPGVHTATVVYWPREEGRSAARTFTWDFYVV